MAFCAPRVTIKLQAEDDESQKEVINTKISSEFCQLFVQSGGKIDFVFLFHSSESSLAPGSPPPRANILIRKIEKQNYELQRISCMKKLSEILKWTGALTRSIKRKKRRKNNENIFPNFICPSEFSLFARSTATKSEFEHFFVFVLLGREEKTFRAREHESSTRKLNGNIAVVVVSRHRLGHKKGKKWNAENFSACSNILEYPEQKQRLKCSASLSHLSSSSSAAWRCKKTFSCFDDASLRDVAWAWGVSLFIFKDQNIFFFIVWGESWALEISAHIKWNISSLLRRVCVHRIHFIFVLLFIHNHCYVCCDSRWDVECRHHNVFPQISSSHNLNKVEHSTTTTSQQSRTEQ